MALQNLIHCGRVLKPHGLKGELCTLWFSDSPLLLTGLRRVYLKNPGSSPRAFNILSWRTHHGKYLVCLDKITGRDLAEKWQGAEIFVQQQYLPQLDGNDTYLFELLKSEVFLAGDTYLGTLEQIFEARGSEVWQIITSEGREVLFPVNQQFIIDIDTDNKKIVIDPPEGLLEIYGVNIDE
jgi:16S rRNA processing protein RimM